MATSDATIETRKSDKKATDELPSVDRMSLFKDFNHSPAAFGATADRTHGGQALPSALTFDNIFEPSKTVGDKAVDPVLAISAIGQALKEGASRVQPVEAPPVKDFPIYNPDRIKTGPVEPQRLSVMYGADTLLSPAGMSKQDPFSLAPDFRKEFKDPRSIDHIKDEAQQLVAADKFPQHMKALFEDDAAKFSKENPGVRGSLFAQTMTSALEAIPDNHGLHVDFAGAEGGRSGKTDVLLMKDQAGKTNEIAEASIQFSSGATPAERADIAKQLRKTLPPDEMSELGKKDRIDQIVKTANDLVVANGLGKDLNPIFSQDIADFSKKNPSVPGDFFARALNGAIKLNPQPAENLQITFSSAGPVKGTGLVGLMDNLQDKGERLLAETPMKFP